MKTITVTAEIRSTTERGLALWQGATHEVVDERTGEILERDHFVWLPKKFATIKREWRDRDNRRMPSSRSPSGWPRTRS